MGSRILGKAPVKSLLCIKVHLLEIAQALGIGELLPDGIDGKE